MTAIVIDSRLLDCADEAESLAMASGLSELLGGVVTVQEDSLLVRPPCSTAEEQVLWLLRDVLGEVHA